MVWRLTHRACCVQRGAEGWRGGGDDGSAVTTDHWYSHHVPHSFGAGALNGSVTEGRSLTSNAV